MKVRTTERRGAHGKQRFAPLAQLAEQATPKHDRREVKDTALPNTLPIPSTEGPGTQLS
jgi:hypothetical protein